MSLINPTIYNWSKNSTTNTPIYDLYTSLRDKLTRHTALSSKPTNDLLPRELKELDQLKTSIYQLEYRLLHEYALQVGVQSDTTPPKDYKVVNYAG